MPARYDPRVPARAPGVLSRAIGDEYVVIHPASRTAHSLTGVAAHVWRATEGGPLPVITDEQLDLAVDQLQALELLALPAPSRRSVLKRAGILVAATGIASIALPEAIAAASTVVGPVTVIGNSLFVIPAGSRNVVITFTGGGGGYAQDRTGTPGSGGSIAFNPGVRLSSALTVTYNIGTMGSAATSAGNTNLTNPGGTGAFAGGAGGGSNLTATPDLGGGGGAASIVVLSGAVGGTLIAGGGGGAGNGFSNSGNPLNGGTGGSVVAGGDGGGGGTGQAGANPGAGGAGVTAGGTGVPGAAGTASATSGTNGGGGGGGGAKRGNAGGNGNTTSSGGGGGAGSSSIGTLTGQSGMAAPTYGTVNGSANGSLTYSYIAP